MDTKEQLHMIETKINMIKENIQYCIEHENAFTYNNLYYELKEWEKLITIKKFLMDNE